MADRLERETFTDSCNFSQVLLMFVSTRGFEQRAAIIVLVSLEVVVAGWSGLGGGQAVAGVPAERFDSIQEAIDKNPGRVVTLDGGVHEIDQPLRFTANNSGLDGDGVVVQRNPNEPVVVVADAEHVRIAHVTLSRPEDTDRSTASAVLVARSSSVTLDGLRVLNNRSQSAAVGFDECQHCTIKDCEVVNYKCIGVDDRTANPMLGYAFNCIDGTGIAVRRSQSINIRSNRVIERVIRPTRENQEKYDLGRLTEGSHPTELGELGRRAVKDDYTNNWHQGSAIFVGDPSNTKHVHIVDNYIENAAQGVDMHCDQSVCARNIICGAMIGLKATHGARNLVLANNIVSRADLWGILLNPGAGSHYGELDEDAKQVSNVDGGTAIANNVITENGVWG